MDGRFTRALTYTTDLYAPLCHLFSAFDGWTKSHGHIFLLFLFLDSA